MPCMFITLRFLFGITAILYRIECITKLSVSLEQQPAQITECSSMANPENKVMLNLTASHWQLIDEQDSIRVFVKDNPNGYKSVRMMLNIHGSLENLQARLQDVKGYTDWVYRCISSTQLSKAGDSILEYQVITDFPFPFKDRILTVRSSQKMDDTGILYSQSSAVPIIDTHDQYAVIHHFTSLWKINPISPDKLSIVYEVTTEPGGDIPVWLYNMAVEQGPLKTMKNLKYLIEEPAISTKR